jgi:hypothetical protein
MAAQVCEEPGLATSEHPKRANAALQPLEIE